MGKLDELFDSIEEAELTERDFEEEEVIDPRMESILKRLICTVLKLDFVALKGVRVDITYKEQLGGGALLKMSYQGRTVQCEVTKTTLAGYRIIQD